MAQPKNRPLIFIALASLCTTFIGCSGYRVTLNNNDIANEREVFTDYQLKDPALQQCVASAFEDATLEQPSGLTRLNCSAQKIRDISGLEMFTQLRYVNLSDNKLGSIAPLLLLNELEEVNLKDNPALQCTEISKLGSKVKKLNAPECG